MKTIFLLFLLLILSSLSFSQTTDSNFEPVALQIRKLQPTGTVYYGENASKEVYKKFRSLLKQSFYSVHSDTSDHERFILTKQEKTFIQLELKRQEIQKLPDSLFQNSKRMQVDSLIPFVDNKNQKLYDSIRKLPDSSQIEFRKQLHRYWSFIFTKPVYLRNRKIALYYFLYYSMSGGSAYCCFDKQENGIWRKWIFVPGLGGNW